MGQLKINILLKNEYEGTENQIKNPESLMKESFRSTDRHINMPILDINIRNISKDRRIGAESRIKNPESCISESF